MTMPLKPGIVTALITPFHDDGRVDDAGLEAIVERQILSGVSGLCVLGGTGEPLGLRQVERENVIDTVIFACGGRVPVIVGLIAARFEEMVKLARHASRRGADAVMAMPPTFVMSSPGHARLLFTDLVAAADEMPLIIFNSPARSGVDLRPDALAEMAGSLPSLAGLKEASGDISHFGETISRLGPNILHFQGWENLLLESLELGADGGFHTLANVIPEECVALTDAYRGGRIERARKLQSRLTELGELMFSEPNPGPTKYLMQRLGLITSGMTRRPIYPVSEASRQAIDAWTGKLGDLSGVRGVS